MGPVLPWAPVGPPGPWLPWAPVGPVGPVLPWAPWAPVGPVSVLHSNSVPLAGQTKTCPEVPAAFGIVNSELEIVPANVAFWDVSSVSAVLKEYGSDWLAPALVWNLSVPLLSPPVAIEAIDATASPSRSLNAIKPLAPPDPALDRLMFIPAAAELAWVVIWPLLVIAPDEMVPAKVALVSSIVRTVTGPVGEEFPETWKRYEP